MVDEQNDGARAHEDLRAEVEKYATGIEDWQKRHAKGNTAIPAAMRRLVRENKRLRAGLVVAATQLRVAGDERGATHAEQTLGYSVAGQEA